MDEQEVTEEQPPAKVMTLEERVAFLETQNEGLKRVGGLALALVLLLGGIVVYQTYSDLQATTTRGITILDDKNQLCSAITTDRQGRLQFLQAKYGTIDAVGDLPPDFRGVAFHDSKGFPRFLMGEDAKGETVFVIQDPVKRITFDPFGKIPKVEATPQPGGSPTPAPTPAPASSPSPKASGQP